MKEHLMGLEESGDGGCGSEGREEGREEVKRPFLAGWDLTGSLIDAWENGVYPVGFVGIGAVVGLCVVGVLGLIFNPSTVPLRIEYNTFSHQPITSAPASSLLLPPPWSVGLAVWLNGSGLECGNNGSGIAGFEDGSAYVDLSTVQAVGTEEFSRVYRRSDLDAGSGEKSLDDDAMEIVKKRDGLKRVKMKGLQGAPILLFPLLGRSGVDVVCVKSGDGGGEVGGSLDVWMGMTTVNQDGKDDVMVAYPASHINPFDLYKHAFRSTIQIDSPGFLSLLLTPSIATGVSNTFNMVSGSVQVQSIQLCQQGNKVGGDDSSLCDSGSSLLRLSTPEVVVMEVPMQVGGTFGGVGGLVGLVTGLIGIGKALSRVVGDVVVREGCWREMGGRGLCFGCGSQRAKVLGLWMDGVWFVVMLAAFVFFLITTTPFLSVQMVFNEVLALFLPLLPSFCLLFFLLPSFSSTFHNTNTSIFLTSLTAVASATSTTLISPNSFYTPILFPTLALFTLLHLVSLTFLTVAALDHHLHSHPPPPPQSPPSKLSATLASCCKCRTRH